MIVSVAAGVVNLSTVLVSDPNGLVARSSKKYVVRGLSPATVNRAAEPNPTV